MADLSRGMSTAVQPAGGRNCSVNSVVLVSRSGELAAALGGVAHHRVESVELLPIYTVLKALILDSEFAKLADISWVRRAYPTAFITVFDPMAAFRPSTRMQSFEAGANMVAHDVPSIIRTLSEAVLPTENRGNITCPYCMMTNLTAREMFFHAPAFHIGWPNYVPVAEECPICRKRLHRRPLQVHIHEHHRPGDVPSSSGPAATQLFHFALCIVRLPGTQRYLLVQEFANEGFWCPGGAVDRAESVQQAALRECLEESGVPVSLKGILAIELHTSDRGETTASKDGGPSIPMQVMRMRVIFYAEPIALDGQEASVLPQSVAASDLSEVDVIRLARRYTTPKSSPDYESAGAVWCSYQDLVGGQIRLRGSEPARWAKYLEEGGAIYPLSLLMEKVG